MSRGSIVHDWCEPETQERVLVVLLAALLVFHSRKAVTQKYRSLFTRKPGHQGFWEVGNNVNTASVKLELKFEV